MKRPVLRTELRIFAVCVILVFIIDYAVGLNRVSPWSLDPQSPLQSRLLPALLLYALSWGVRLAAGLLGKDAGPSDSLTRNGEGEDG
ncbi:MAG TPA: hypothetical protein VLU25_16350 [Acidobacteriota bacterium]|nr:hypothetical protein [Acidobacteriota bacterium]